MSRQWKEETIQKLVPYLVVGLGGFVGANARFVIGEWAAEKLGTGLPYGTFIINVTGSFILGLFGTLALSLGWSQNWRQLVAIGFVGAYTTFSTFEYETLQLIVNGGRYRAAAMNLAGSVVAGFFAAWLGIILARLLLRGRA